MKTVSFNNKENPFGKIAFLEGGTGLNNEEDEMYKLCKKYNYKVIEIDDLYENPNKLRLIEEFKPDTIVVGTTGLFKEKLIGLIDLFFSLDISSIKNVILAVNSEDVFWRQILELKRINKDIEFYDMAYGWNDEYLFKEIEVEE